MRIADDIKPVTYMKMRSAELLAGIQENRRPVVITQNGEPRAVLLDVESYQALRDTSLLLKLIARSEEQIRAARTTPQDEVFERMERRLAANVPAKHTSRAVRSHRKKRARR